MLRLRGGTRKVCSVAFAPDGTLLATASWDYVRQAASNRIGEVILWDLSTRQPRRSLAAGQEGAYRVAFSPDGRLLVAGGENGLVRLWDTVTGREQGRVTGLGQAVADLAFAPDGGRLAAALGTAPVPSNRSGGRAQGELVSWDLPALLRDWSAAPRHPLTVPGQAWSLAYAPDGQGLVLGTGHGTVGVVDPVRGDERDTFRLHDSGARALAVSPDGVTLAGAAGTDVVLWDLAAGQVRATLRGHQFWVWSIAFSPDGRRLLTGSWDSTVRLWDVATGRERACFNWDTGKVHAVAFSPDGMTAAAAGDSRSVLLWDVDEGAT